jgi:hypothetical protein
MTRAERSSRFETSCAPGSRRACRLRAVDLFSGQPPPKCSGIASIAVVTSPGCSSALLLREHVVALVELAPGDKVVVDCLNPAWVPDMVPIDEVIFRTQFRSYSSLNLKRLRLDGLISRIELHAGAVPYWLEQPHLIKATLWLFLALLLAIPLVIGSFLGWRKSVRRANAAWDGEAALDLPAYPVRPLRSRSSGDYRPATAAAEERI